MNKTLLIILKILMPIALLGGAFYPQYGAAWYIFSNFMAMPIVWIVVIAIWFALLALNLPLRQDQFRIVTTTSILAISGATLWALSNNGYFDVTNLNSWAIAAILISGFILGWWTVSVPLLRKWRGIFVTDNSDEPIEG